MTIIKGMLVILIGLCIDGMQAMVSFVCFALGAALGTAGGAVGGAVIGAKACGFAGSAVAAACATAGGTVGGLLGSAADPVLAPVGIPLGIALGFALNICISLTIGTAFVVIVLPLCGMFYPGYIWPAFIGEAIPGLDNIPGWTTLAVLCVLKKARKEGGGVSRVVASAASAAINPASAVGFIGGAIGGISAIKQEVSEGARHSTVLQNTYESEPAQELSQTRQNLRATVGQELRMPRIINRDIAARPANDNFHYAQEAA